MRIVPLVIALLLFATGCNGLSSKTTTETSLPACENRLSPTSELVGTVSFGAQGAGISVTGDLKLSDGGRISDGWARVGIMITAASSGYATNISSGGSDTTLQLKSKGDGCVKTLEGHSSVLYPTGQSGLEVYFVR